MKAKIKLILMIIYSCLSIQFISCPILKVTFSNLTHLNKMKWINFKCYILTWSIIFYPIIDNNLGLKFICIIIIFSLACTQIEVK